MCADSYSLSVPPPKVLPQWHEKDPGHSANSAGGRLHINAHTLLTQRSRSGNLSKNELTRNLSGKIRLQSSQLAEPLWTDPGIKSGISVRGLISTSKTKENKQKNKKKHRQGMNGRTFSQNPRTRGKSHHHSRQRVSGYC